MDGGAWWTTVHGVAKSRTRLSNFTSPKNHYIQKRKSIKYRVSEKGPPSPPQNSAQIPTIHCAPFTLPYEAFGA